MQWVLSNALTDALKTKEFDRKNFDSVAISPVQKRITLTLGRYGNSDISSSVSPNAMPYHQSIIPRHSVDYI